MKTAALCFSVHVNILKTELSFREKKGEGSPSEVAKAEEEHVDAVGGESKSSRKSPIKTTGVSPYLQPKEEREEKDKGVSTTPEHTEDRKPLPRRREEEKESIRRSRTPKRRQEKDKRRRRRGESRSAEVSGSEVRRQKREVTDSQKEKKERSEEEAAKESAIEREPYLRPRPTQRKPRSPHTPERPRQGDRRDPKEVVKGSHKEVVGGAECLIQAIPVGLRGPTKGLQRERSKNFRKGKHTAAEAVTVGKGSHGSQVEKTCCSSSSCSTSS